MCATIIIGPNNLFREGLSRILGGADFKILNAVSSVDGSFLEALVDHEDLLFIVDAGDNLPHLLEQIRLIKSHRESWRVVVLDNESQPAKAFPTYVAGANAYVANVASSAAFIKYLELVMLGETIMPGAFLPPMLDGKVGAEDGFRRDDGAPTSNAVTKEASPVTADSLSIRQLSAREKTILRCIIEGCSNKAIARKVAISEATVKVHVKSILRKFRVHSRTQAAIWGMSCGSALWGGSDSAAPLAPIVARSSASPQAATRRAIARETQLLTRSVRS